MSVDTFLLLAFWAALVPLAYIGWVDVVIPDLFTIPATIAGIVLAFVFDAPNILLTGAAVALGYCLPLALDAILGFCKSEIRIGLGAVKGCGMLGAYLGIKYTLVALTMALVFSSLLFVVLKWRVLPLGIPIAFSGFVASLLRLAGWL